MQWDSQTLGSGQLNLIHLGNTINLLVLLYFTELQPVEESWRVRTSVWRDFALHTEYGQITIQNSNFSKAKRLSQADTIVYFAKIRSK